MAWDEEEDTTTYQVLLTDESRAYTIVPEGQKFPVGWKDAGVKGDKEECLKYIQRAWAEMRPLALDEIEERVRLS
jgi:MbtH protein